MNYASPEERGLSSAHILEYVKSLEEKKLSTHDLIIMRGEDILFEKYWEPFHKEYLHRMYSVSKSFVALAVGFAEQDGLLSLDDKIIQYFPDEMKSQADENMRNQTIRHMLMMSTAKEEQYWFHAKPKDRVQFYFDNDRKESRPPGTIFQYDSMGSFVLGALIERLTEMTLMDYLREKFLNEIGFSEEGYCLACPGGHSWGDSAIICKATDLLKVARFVMNKGSWNGKQLLNEQFVTEATAKQIETNEIGNEEYNSQGYGYYIWRTYQNSFSFNGMGCQFAICVPEKDLILIYNGDNQGNAYAARTIFDNFFRMIVNRIEEKSLSVDIEKQKELNDYTKNLKLAAIDGKKQTEWTAKVHDVTYELDDNPMGITEFKLTFEGKQGVFAYTNGQGYKEIKFGVCENVCGIFPQEGYSGKVGCEETKGILYKCAASAAWTEAHKLFLKVQIIDAYFGRLNIIFSFRDNLVGVCMNKAAEDFLNEYEGYASGRRVE